MGIEPTFPAWKASIINHYTTPAYKNILIQKYFFIKSFGVLGIEPSQRAPKARVLPVYDTPTTCPVPNYRSHILQIEK